MVIRPGNSKESINCNSSKVCNGITIQETCQRLGKSESTIRRMIKAGKLVAIKKDGVYDIPEDFLPYLCVWVLIKGQYRD